MCGPWLKGEKGNFLGDMSTWLGEVTFDMILKNYYFFTTVKTDVCILIFSCQQMKGQVSSPRN